jgi:hypothetical protein
LPNLLYGFLALAISWTVPTRAEAQWLNPHLEAKRYDNLRRHQQRQRERARARQKASGAAATGTPGAAVSVGERQAAWRANQSVYRQRLLRDGRQAADRWLDQIVLRNRRR